MMEVTIGQSEGLKAAILETLMTQFSFKLFVGIFAALLIKMAVTTLFNYLVIRFSFIGERTPFIYKGREAYINKLTLSNVELITTDGSRVHIPLGTFIKMDKEVPSK